MWKVLFKPSMREVVYTDFVLKWFYIYMYSGVYGRRVSSIILSLIGRGTEKNKKISTE